MIHNDLKSDLERLNFTPFQIKVYLETAKIKKGKTSSYGEIARRIGHPHSARAVGTALKNNPFPGTRVPCHRVIHSNGKIEGFMGSTAKGSKENLKKIRLLKQEKAL